MLNEILEKIWAKKFVFLGTFFLVFTITYIALVALDYLPEDPKSIEEKVDSVEELSESLTNDTATAASPAENAATESDEVALEGAALPLSIYIEKLGKTVTVLNPTSRTIADLDTALLDGVVRHPDSATLLQTGNVFILGHSSYLPNVFNKNFQAFNGIQNLAWGDQIKVSSEDTVYEYRVEKVYRAKAENVTVPIAGLEKRLTLATCNSFGSVDDRYVVEAELISEQKL